MELARSIVIVGLCVALLVVWGIAIGYAWLELQDQVTPAKVYLVGSNSNIRPSLATSTDHKLAFRNRWNFVNFLQDEANLQWTRKGIVLPEPTRLKIEKLALKYYFNPEVKKTRFNKLRGHKYLILVLPDELYDLMQPLE